MTKKESTGDHFSDLPIDGNILSALSKKGFEVPTPIQHQIIPGAIEGKDVIGIAQTGTGKTLAFGIPLIQRLLKNKGQGLILVPTRELASQVEEAIYKVGGILGIKCAVVIGGASANIQIKALRKNPHIVVATPGRLVDLIGQGAYKLDRINAVVLDEADRMLDIGFLPQIKEVLKSCPKERQTMLFSATMPSSITSLANNFMRVPLRIEVAPQGTAAENVEQEIYMVPRGSKMRLLDSILEKNKTAITLIFSRTKHGAKKMARDIRYMGHTATEIHSNRSQAQRRDALAGFANGRYRVLVATDIAARGIDVKDITLVINYDLPENSGDYVHRIGRTGRAGRSGKAISFATSSQKPDVHKIERLIRKTLPIVPLPQLPPERDKPKYEPRSHGGDHRGGRNKYSGNFQRRGQSHKRRDDSRDQADKRKRNYSQDSQSQSGRKDYRKRDDSRDQADKRKRNYSHGGQSQSEGRDYRKRDNATGDQYQKPSRSKKHKKNRNSKSHQSYTEWSKGKKYKEANKGSGRNNNYRKYKS